MTNKKFPEGDETIEETVNVSADANAPEKVADWLTVLGGKSNVTTVAACAQSRIRLTVKDNKNIDETSLKEKGVAAVVRIEDNLFHLLVGLNADQYAAEMSGQIAGN